MKNKWVALAILVLSASSIESKEVENLSEATAIKVVESFMNEHKKSLGFLDRIQSLDDLTDEEAETLYLLIQKSKRNIRSAWTYSEIGK